ncbi:hypothetical protein VNO80_22653 [Phaseolus coccineus]|uniref:Uncharacterized protein n=1 Tax=Phaseolus coccineus TaxID=3886 RepID=A0AAN9M5I3_PHACN
MLQPVNCSSFDFANIKPLRVKVPNFLGHWEELKGKTKFVLKLDVPNVVDNWEISNNILLASSRFLAETVS